MFWLFFFHSLESVRLWDFRWSERDSDLRFRRWWAGCLCSTGAAAEQSSCKCPGKCEPFDRWEALLRSPGCCCTELLCEPSLPPADADILQPWSVPKKKKKNFLGHLQDDRRFVYTSGPESQVDPFSLYEIQHFSYYFRSKMALKRMIKNESGI